MQSESIFLKENKIHGSAAFPCASYRADRGNYGPDEPFLCKHHWHEETEILYFEEGSYHLEINMEKYDVTAPCFCFLGSGDLHAIFCPGGFTESAVVFSPAMLRFAQSDAAAQTYIEPLIASELSLPRFLFPSHPAYAAVRQLYTDIMNSFLPDALADFGRPRAQYIFAAPAGQLRIKASLFMILAVLAEHGLLSEAAAAPNYRVEAIKKSLTYMRNNYQNKVYISDLADQVSMNKDYFCRFFKSVIGKSPMEYLNEMRIRHAMRLLRTTEDSVMNISLECGFHNLGNFMRTFKKQLGCTPLQYRKSAVQAPEAHLPESDSDVNIS